jgi:hypothetical protein
MASPEWSRRGGKPPESSLDGCCAYRFDAFREDKEPRNLAMGVRTTLAITILLELPLSDCVKNAIINLLSLFDISSSSLTVKYAVFFLHCRTHNWWQQLSLRLVIDHTFLGGNEKISQIPSPLSLREFGSLQEFPARFEGSFLLLLASQLDQMIVKEA